MANRWALGLALTAWACGESKDLGSLEPLDPDTAPRAVIDRFSPEAGTMHVRSATNALPGPDEAIDFDALFLRQGFAPDGRMIQQYDFDVQPAEPALIYVLYYEGDEDPIPGQLSIVDTIPGDEGYSDYWWVVRVDAPREYRANAITDVRQIAEYSLATTVQDRVRNCPFVPDGSTATLRLDGADPALRRAWYFGQVVFYFSFREGSLVVTEQDLVPLSDSYVAFNVNGDPSSGFMTEVDGVQTHNVVATIPPDPLYSSFVRLHPWDNAEFASVTDLATAQAATPIGAPLEPVNWPVVYITP